MRRQEYGGQRTEAQKIEDEKFRSLEDEGKEVRGRKTEVGDREEIDGGGPR